MIFSGVPEGHLALAQAAVYLSLAPKSNALYTAYGEVLEDVQQDGSRSGAAAFAECGDGPDEKLGFGQRLNYAHDYEDK